MEASVLLNRSLRKRDSRGVGIGAACEDQRTVGSPGRAAEFELLGQSRHEHDVISRCGGRGFERHSRFVVTALGRRHLTLDESLVGVR